MSSSFNLSSTRSLDDLLLQSLLSKLHLNPQSPKGPNPSSSLDDLLLSLSSSDDEESSQFDHLIPNFPAPNNTQLAIEESKLERKIIRLILSGKTETLKPNSGQAVSIGDNDVCVGFHEETGSEYRVWEWHGHVMVEEEGGECVPEYVYGNYFERIGGNGIGGIGIGNGNGMMGARWGEEEEDEEEEEEVVEEEKVGSLGLKELIGENGVAGSRILHRNLNATGPSIYLVGVVTITFPSYGIALHFRNDYCPVLARFHYALGYRASAFKVSAGDRMQNACLVGFFAVCSIAACISFRSAGFYNALQMVLFGIWLVNILF
ncbi:hypothetical protein AKJ16_DCAP21425 [Drosera capensis]